MLCVSFMLKFIYTAFMLIVIMLSAVTIVEHSPHHPKVMSSCPDLERKKHPFTFLKSIKTFGAVNYIVIL